MEGVCPLPIPVGRFVYDASGTIVEADDSACRLSQRPLVGLRLPSAEHFALPQDATLPTELPRSRCRVIRLGDGSATAFLLNYTPAGGRVAVTMEPLEWSMGFLDQLPAPGAALADERGVVVHHNAALSVLLGIPAERLRGARAALLAERLALGRRDIAGAFRGALRGSARADVFAFAHPDGGQRRLSIRVVPWRYQGLICGVVWLAVDMTEAAEATRQANIAASHRMAAVLQHELRNPLQTIQAAAALLRADVPPEKRHALALLEEQVQLIEYHLANRLQPPRPGALGLGKVSDVVAAEIERTSVRFITRRLRFEHRRLKREPAVLVHAPSLGRAFANLFRNTAQVRRDATIRIRYALRDDMLACTIADDGPGFPRAMLNGPPLAPPGSDPTEHLGLQVVFAVVRAHGGEVALSNASRGGARVVVRLPVAVGRAGADPAPDTEAEVAAADT